MSDTVFDEDTQLDCIVGGALEKVPTTDNMRAELHVIVRGEDVSGFGALACTQELKYLIQAFRSEASPGQELVQRLADMPLRGDRTIEVTLHDLGLDSAVEDELRDLIQRLVELHMDSQPKK